MQESNIFQNIVKKLDYDEAQAIFGLTIICIWLMALINYIISII